MPVFARCVFEFHAHLQCFKVVCDSFHSDEWGYVSRLDQGNGSSQVTHMQSHTKWCLLSIYSTFSVSNLINPFLFFHICNNPTKIPLCYVLRKIGCETCKKVLFYFFCWLVKSGCGLDNLTFHFATDFCSQVMC